MAARVNKKRTPGGVRVLSIVRIEEKQRNSDRSVTAGISFAHYKMYAAYGDALSTSEFLCYSTTIIVVLYPFVKNFFVFNAFSPSGISNMPE